MTWTDYDDPRGFHVFDTETRELKFIRNPYKMFHKIKYDDTEQTMEYWQDMNMSEYKNTMLKVIVVNKQNPYLFDTVIDSLYKAEAMDISIVEDFTDIIENEEVDEVDSAEDTMTILSKHIDSLTLNVNGDKLKSFMKELYVEALNTETSE